MSEHLEEALPKKMLETVQLCKQYRDGPLALDRLDLSVRKGEIYCLLGPNGAGKTTLINLFLGFLTPTSGSCFVNGVNVQENPLDAKRDLAYIPENVALYPNLTALQNLRYFARLGRDGSVNREECEAALFQMGLQPDAFHRNAGKLSKGMRQKLGLAVAVIRDAGVILLDEPTSGLAPEAASELLSGLVDLKKRGKTVFMSTHDIFRIREVASRVGILKKGRLVAELEREDLLSRNLLEIYMGLMPAAGESPADEDQPVELK